MARGKLIFIKGLPFSGKSVVAQNFKESGGAVIISWHPKLCPNYQERCETSLLDAVMRAGLALKEGKTVVIDECNLSGSATNPFIIVASAYKAKVVWRLIKTDVATCQQRCMKNGGNAADLVYLDLLNQIYMDKLKR